MILIMGYGNLIMIRLGKQVLVIGRQSMLGLCLAANFSGKKIREHVSKQVSSSRASKMGQPLSSIKSNEPQAVSKAVSPQYQKEMADLLSKKELSCTDL
jgi:hypothetical protein